MDQMFYIGCALMIMIGLLLASCAPVKGNVYPLGPKYLRHDSLLNELNEIASLNPELCKLKVIGFSSREQLPIHALEIGHSEAKRKVLIIGQHHGDEVIGVNVSVAYARHLAAGKGKNADCADILSHTKFWIIPTINPEAFRIVSSGEYRFKRKNNRDSDGNKKFNLRTDGVDLNRNYPVYWDLDIDTNPESPYYKGAEPASEQEVQAVITLALQQGFDNAIFFHSSASGAYSEMIFLPSADGNQELYDQTMDLALRYASMLKKDYKPGTYDVHSDAVSQVGNARNYFFHRLGCKAFLVELGGINNQGISVIHPSDEILARIIKRQLSALDRLFCVSPETNSHKQFSGSQAPGSSNEIF